MTDRGQTGEVTTDRLFNALAEQLKNPLLQIAYQAEADGTGALHDVGVTASRALHLIESYLLGAGQQALALEPVSVSSVMYDVAQALQPLARQYGAEIEIDIAGRYGPVMANQRGLEAALVTVGQSLLEADTTAHPRLMLSAYKTAHGIAAGIFGAHPDLSPDNFRRALGLFGRARQPMPGASSLNAAGLYVAEAIFETMDSHLNVARRHNLNGLAARLVPSQQLQLV
jgi:hypothetical protein